MSVICTIAFTPPLKETEGPFVIGEGGFGQGNWSRKPNNLKINVPVTILHSKTSAAASYKKKAIGGKKKKKRKIFKE